MLVKPWQGLSIKLVRSAFVDVVGSLAFVFEAGGVLSGLKPSPICYMPCEPKKQADDLGYVRPPAFVRFSAMFVHPKLAQNSRLQSKGEGSIENRRLAVRPISTGHLEPCSIQGS